jgi:hypothetical protein
MEIQHCRNSDQTVKNQILLDVHSPARLGKNNGKYIFMLFISCDFGILSIICLLLLIIIFQSNFK